jgi:hypothetical protein
MSQPLVRAMKFVGVLAVAIAVGVAVTIGCAWLSHNVLVLAYGEDLAPIDDTLPMVVALWTAYLAGILTGLAVVVLGSRRLVLRPPAATGPHQD